MATDEESPLVAGELPLQPLNHKRDVYLLCWAFLLIFLAYGAVQNLESTMNTVSNFLKNSLISRILILGFSDENVFHLLF